jgi:hypothetical protein
LAKPKIAGRANANLRSDKSGLEIPRTSLEHIEAFFLKYYRDEVAEVDHIDLEAVDVDTGKQDVRTCWQAAAFSFPFQRFF